jgi:hypothetical protein
MFTGHWATGLGAKAVSPKTSLGTLFLASQFVDLLWPIAILVGLETVEINPDATPVVKLEFTHYPYSHSLAMSLLWAALFAGAYWWRKKDRRGALVLGGVVLSHWILDLVSHKPDLALAPGIDTKVGLGLWYSFAGTIVVEAALYATGVWLYLKSTRAKDKLGSYGLWSMVGLLALINMVVKLGPPPQSATAMAGVGMTQWLFVAWAYWVDRHREAAPS